MGWTTTGTRVKISNVPASTILFSRNGSQTIRQLEVVETTEIRGLTQSAAEGMCGIEESTTQTSYYAKINGTVFTFTGTTGTKTELSGARADDSGQWVVTERVTTYSITPNPLPSCWGTTELNEDGEEITLSANGKSRNISIDFSSSRLWVFNAKPVNQTIRTVMSEIRYVNSESAANSLVTANTGDTVGDTTIKQDGQIASGSGTTQTVPVAWCTVKTGVEKFASARFVSEREGWTVNVTTKTFGYAAAGWHT